MNESSSLLPRRCHARADQLGLSITSRASSVDIRVWLATAIQFTTCVVPATPGVGFVGMTRDARIRAVAC